MKQPAFTANWHTHTFRCGHASGDAADYCKAAADAGLCTIGFTDHSPLKDGRWRNVRMPYSEMPGYVRAIDEAAAAFPSLNVFKGLECEWVPAFGASYYEEDLRVRFGLDYISLAPHAFTMEKGSERWYDSFHWDKSQQVDVKEWLRGYARYVVEAIQTGLFDFVAHPDLLGCFCPDWCPEAASASREIIQAAKAAGMLLEINASGFVHPKVQCSDGTMRFPYPWRPFWEIAAEEGARVFVNTDAHNPESIVQYLHESYALADEVGITISMPQTINGLRPWE